MPDQIEQVAQKAIREKVFPGCVVGIIRGASETISTFGTIIYDSEEKVREDTIYDVASITKSIPTASLALELIVEGRLELERRVVEYLPELRNDHGATIRDLLTYTVVGPRMSELCALSDVELRRKVLAMGFVGPPGEKKYGNAPSFLLGLVIERVTGASLDTLARQYFFGPLGMTSTTFFPDDGFPKSIIAPTEISDGHEIRGIVHDESARVFGNVHIAVGHAGLFSSAPDLLRFLRALLTGRYPHILAGAQEGLGWQVGEKYFMGERASARTIGKTGFTGTSVLLDAERVVTLVILSNRTYPKRPGDDSAINAFRRTIADIVLSV